MRWIRFLLTLLAARQRDKLRIDGESRIRFRVWLTDIDVSIMNHAAMLSVMETGRIDFMVRTGFLKLARKNKWYFPSSSIHVQFFRPLKLFQRATLVTKVFHVDEKSIYIEQKIIRQNKLIAVCVVKSTVKKGRDQVNVLDVLNQLNIGKAPKEAQSVIDGLEQSNELVRKRLL
jgi:acyl-CoA thioesterase FadM